MFGRYSLDVDGLVYAGGEWDASKYACGLMLFRIRKFSPEVKKAIREKGKQMHPTYSFGLKNIGAILSETPRENLIAV